MDPKVNGQLQNDWGWLIAAYLFLGGVGAGAYVVAAINGFGQAEAPMSTVVGLWVSWPALLIGTICLLADLGQPMKAVLAGLKPGTSWIARGFWVITVFMILAFLHTVMLMFAGDSTGAISTISVLGIIFAVGTMAYTGILLGASKGIPFWRTGAVPVVFVVSALVTGHFTVMLGMILAGGTSDLMVSPMQEVLEGMVLVAVEILAIAFFLQAAFKQPDSRESVERILRRPSFTIGYAVLGLAVPCVLMLLLYYSMQDSGVGAFGAVATIGALLGLMGGLLLRHAVLVCGTLPTWNIGGFAFRRIARPKEPKPGIGSLPPQ